MKLNFNFGIITPIWKTDYSHLKEMVESLNRLFRLGITFDWSIIVDGDKRDVDVFLRQIIDPLLLQNTFISTLNKHCGPSFARNYGVKLLDCDFICWLDADDAIDPRNFITILTELNSKDKTFWDNYDLVYTDSYDCDSYLNVISTRKKKFIHNLHCKYKNTVFDPLLGVDFIYQLQFIKKESFSSVGGFNEQKILGEDVDLVLRISEMSKNVNFFHIPIPVYCYRNNPNGRSNVEWRKLKDQMERIYLESSRRQYFPIHGYKYIGEFSLSNGVFQHPICCDNTNNPLYDIYLPLDETNRVILPLYVKYNG